MMLCVNTLHLIFRKDREKRTGDLKTVEAFCLKNNKNQCIVKEDTANQTKGGKITQETSEEVKTPATRETTEEGTTAGLTEPPQQNPLLK